MTTELSRGAGDRSEAAPGWYRPVEPPADMTGLVSCAWTAEPTGRHRLTPDACIDVLWLSSGPVVVCGPETSSWEFELAAGTSAVGVRLRPGVAGVVFHLDVSTITDRNVPLAALAGAEAERTVARRIEAQTTATLRRDALVEWLRDHAGDVRRNDPVAEAVLRRLEVAPRAGQAELAAAVGLSVRQLHRRSLRSFGYGTATLARIMRFQRLLAAVERDSTGRSLGELAALAGFADHAHLAHDCRAITGLTPTRFLAEYFPTFPDMSDPYKTAMT